MYTLEDPEKLVEELVKRISKTSEISVLEFGSGSGKISIPVINQFNNNRFKDRFKEWKWIGYEIDEDKIKAFIKNIKNDKVNINQCDLEKVVFEKEQNLPNMEKNQEFDIVFMPNFLYHIVHREKVLELALRYLKKDGLLIVGEPGGFWTDCEEFLPSNQTVWANFWKEFRSINGFFPFRFSYTTKLDKEIADKLGLEELEEIECKLKSVNTISVQDWVKQKNWSFIKLPIPAIERDKKLKLPTAPPSIPNDNDNKNEQVFRVYRKINQVDLLGQYEYETVKKFQMIKFLPIKAMKLHWFSRSFLRIITELGVFKKMNFDIGSIGLNEIDAIIAQKSDKFIPSFSFFINPYKGLEEVLRKLHGYLCFYYAPQDKIEYEYNKKSIEYKAITGLLTEILPKKFPKIEYLIIKVSNKSNKVSNKSNNKDIISITQPQPQENKIEITIETTPLNPLKNFSFNNRNNLLETLETQLSQENWVFYKDNEKDRQYYASLFTNKIVLNLDESKYTLKDEAQFLEGLDNSHKQGTICRLLLLGKFFLHFKLNYSISIPIRGILQKKDPMFLGLVWLIYENENGPDWKNIEFFLTLLNIYSSAFREFVIEGSLTKIESHALRSAIAAIMARNMSHNIGSHVLAKMGYESPVNLNVANNQVFYRYLQQRMDFVALVSTEFPEWTSSSWFIREIMYWFYQQEALLRYIVRQEGIKGTYKWNNTSNDDKENEDTLLVKIRIRENDEEKDGWIIHENKNKIVENPLSKDFMLAIPGAIVGYHAFYMILENIIRNSAKHNWANLKEEEKSEKNIKQLKISINAINDPKKDYVLFRIYDNISTINIRKDGDKKLLPDEIKKFEGKNVETLPLHQQINCKLTKSVLDNTGKLIKANWGMAEMKISIGFLKKLPVEKIGAEGIEIIGEEGDKKKLYIVRAIAFPDPESKETNLVYRLAYEFILPKPKEVGIIGKLKDSNGNDAN